MLAKVAVEELKIVPKEYWEPDVIAASGWVIGLGLACSLEGLDKAFAAYQVIWAWYCEQIRFLIQADDTSQAFVMRCFDKRR